MQRDRTGGDQTGGSRRAPTRSPRERWIRVGLAAALVVVAVSWPMLELGPQGPVLLVLAPAQGVVAADLLALIPLALAIFLVLPLRRRRPSR